MPLPRLPCVATALALGLAVAATPAAAQGTTASTDATGAFFRSYLTTPVAALASPLAAPDEAGSSGREDASAPGWLGGNGRYVVGGAAAFGAGLALLGSHGSPSLSAGSAAGPAGTPVATTPGTLGTGNVVVNPEPGTVLLMGTGLAALVLIGRRRAAVRR
ncbi:MAG TPA: PEP-CTERM sorting domain-containing protein [Gemmatimonadaceae bacterium]|nr:PEP-CTERM sorting domain-containing protein [Gemmatimonadaceae bacterium]